MTDKQRGLIIYLDSLCKERGLKVRASDEDKLGKDWLKSYRNFTPDYTSEVINQLKTALGMPINDKKKRRK